MAHDDAERKIRQEKQNTHSTDEQVKIDREMYDEEIGPDHDGIKASDVEDELGLDLDYDPRTSLKHLVDVGMIEEFSPPGPDTFVIAEWQGTDGEIINGQVGMAADQGLEAVIDHIQDEDPPDEGETPAVADGGATTPRTVVAEGFDLVPEKVEEFLRTTEDRVDALNTAVEAIEESDDVSARDDYGEIAFINMPYRYRLTEKSVRFHER